MPCRRWRAAVKFSIRSEAAPLGTFEEQVLLAVFRTTPDA
jgi:hypothetical protein